MVFHIVHIQTTVDNLEVELNILLFFIKTTPPSLPPSHLSLSDGHPVVVHLVKAEVSVGMQGLERRDIMHCNV